MERRGRVRFSNKREGPAPRFPEQRIPQPSLPLSRREVLTEERIREIIMEMLIQLGLVNIPKRREVSLE